MMFKKILAFFILLSILAGCSKTNDHIEVGETASSKTVAFSSMEPSHEISGTLSDTSQTEQNTETVNQPIINEEPDSPLTSIYLSQANQDISDKLVATFFDFFMNKPIYYDFHTEKKADDHIYDVVMALDEQGRTYIKIADGQNSLELIRTDTKKYFLLDENEQTAREVKPEQTGEQILYLESFDKMNEFAQRLYYVGSGRAVFYGQEVEFEEYTQDNTLFIRYYFAQKKCLGFRTFVNQEMQSETKIKALYNKFPVEVHLFDIPDNYRIINLQDDMETDPEITETIANEVIQESATITP